MNRPRRIVKPKELKLLKLKPDDYKLIGELVVLSGIVEQQLKRLIVLMVRAPWPDGLALVAHLNITSLFDIAKSLVPSCVKDSALKENFLLMVWNGRQAFDKRNDLAHGPFEALFAVKMNENTIFKVTARGKIGYKVIRVSPRLIKDAFILMRDTNAVIWVCSLDLEKEHEKLDREHLKLQTQNFAAKASLRKSPRKHQSSQEK